MKNICCIQAVVLVIILVVAAVYVIRYKLEDWFIKSTKIFLISEIVENWDNEVKHINESVQKDSLRSLMIYYIENIKSMEEVVNLDQEKFSKEFNLVIKDSLTTK